MYKAKERGPGEVETFDVEMRTRALNSTSSAFTVTSLADPSPSPVIENVSLPVRPSEEADSPSGYWSGSTPMPTSSFPPRRRPG